MSNSMSNPIGTIIKLLVASLIVGWILKALNLDASDLLDSLGGFADTLMNIFAGFVGWAAGPILVGAVIVVPIWLIRVIWKRAAERRG
jgi:predicted acyltransferase